MAILESGSAPGLQSPRFETVLLEHQHLLEAIPEENLNSEHIERIRAFLRQVSAAGALLDTVADRKTAQGLLDYWSATLYTANRVERCGMTAAQSKALRYSAQPSSQKESTSLQRLPQEETTLVRFNTETVANVAGTAETAIKSLPADEKALAKRIFLRLVRLSDDSQRFNPAAASREDLWKLGDREKVERVIDRFAAADVLQATEQMVELRYPALIRNWPRYSNWLDKRTGFREAVNYWARHKGDADQKAALLSGKLLREAEKYQDLNSDEIKFVEASRDREQKSASKDRFWKRVFMAVAAAAMVAAGLAAWEGSRAREQTLLANEETLRANEESQRANMQREAIELNASAQNLSTFAIASLLIKEDSQDAVHAAKKIMIIHSLRQVLFAPDAKSKKSAIDNWTYLEIQLCEHDPQYGSWFSGYLRRDRKEEIDRIIGAEKLERSAIAALQEIASDFRKYIHKEDTRETLERLKPELFGETVRVSKRLLEAAKHGFRIECVEPYRIAYWRLTIGLELVPAESYHATFTAGLQRWEDTGVASKETVAALEKGFEIFDKAAGRQPE